MKNKRKKGLKAFCSGVFVAGIIFSGSVLGAELDIQVTKQFEEWNKLVIEEREPNSMPRTYSTLVPDDVLEDVSEKTVPSLLNELVGNFKMRNKKASLQDIGATTYLDDYYYIGSKLNLRIEHQMSTQQCWAFSTIKALETNFSLKNNMKEIPNLSERHMDYATSKTFSDGINESGFNREVGDGGFLISALVYLTNGQGAVLESEMPFEDNEDKITLASIDKPVDTIVTEYVSLPIINKQYSKDSNGNTISVTYTDPNGNVYTEAEVEAKRNIIKKHIVENGAVSTVTAGNQAKYYDNSNNVFKATNYNCNAEDVIRDHAVTIVGWDDNYSKDNFAEGAKPSKDGAYIVLNSYGKESFYNGYLYISYEDFFIESDIYGIKNSDKKDYDNIYQADFYGGIYTIGTSETDTGYYANIYERDKSKTEIITDIGITVFDYVDVEIYINPNNGNMNESSLIKIGENDELLEPGYHRLEVDSTKLTGDEFAIVVKQKSANGIFYFALESPVPNTLYSIVDSENNSYYSLDGEYWENLKELYIPGFQMEKSDVCIKAFTTVETSSDNDEENNDTENGDTENGDTENGDTENGDTENGDTENDNNENNDNENNSNNDNYEITIDSSKYLIKEKEIYKIAANTSITEFKKNIQTQSKIKIYEKEKEITDNSQLIKTGMKIRLDNGEEYILIVRGDIDCDGKVSLTDLSNLILHYNETRGYILTGSPHKAADMNYDEKVSLVDISQLLIIYNSK